MMIFVSAGPPTPGEEADGQQPPATGSVTLYWCHEKTEAALHRLIKLYQQLAGCPALSSLSLSVSLRLNLSPLFVCPSLKHTIPPSHTRNPLSFHTIHRGEHLHPLTSNPLANIYRAVLIYLRLISKR